MTKTLGAIEIRTRDRIHDAEKQAWREAQRACRRGVPLDAELTAEERALKVFTGELVDFYEAIHSEIRDRGRRAAPTAEAREEWRRLTDMQPKTWLGIKLPWWVSQ